ncbi:MAG: condensation domain-containing protein [Candidatus Thorarchaeota archaeon]
MITTEESKPYRRIITGQERRFLFGPNAHISLVLRLKGQVSKEALEKAVEKMLITYPQFRVRIEWDEAGVHDSTTEGAAKIPVKVYPRESDSHWKDVLNLEHAIPLRPSKGPLTRFILVKGDDTSELIVFCHHTISDGRSLEFALREVLLHLNDPERKSPEFLDVPPQTLDIFPKGSEWGRVKRGLVGRINKNWQREKVPFDEEDLVNIWEASWKNTSYGIEIIEFDENETKGLVEVSRENVVTLNSTLLIALVKARIDAVGPYDGKAKVATAVDARRRLRIDCSDAVGFYAGGSFMEFKYKESAPLWDNVRVYHKAVSKDLENNNIFETVVSHHYLDQTLVDAMSVAFYGDQIEPHQSRYSKLSAYASKKDGMVTKYLERIGGRAPDIISTNLGKLSIPDKISGIEVERAFFTPSAGMKMEIVLGIATASGKLTVTMNYYRGYVDANAIRRIRDRAEEILRGLIQD